MTSRGQYALRNRCRKNSPSGLADVAPSAPPAWQRRTVTAMTGTAPEVIDRIAEYIEVGVDGLNIAFRPPIDWDAFEAYIDRVLPVFHQSA